MPDGGISGFIGEIREKIDNHPDVDKLEPGDILVYHPEYEFKRFKPLELGLYQYSPEARTEPLDVELTPEAQQAIDTRVAARKEQEEAERQRWLNSPRKPGPPRDWEAIGYEEAADKRTQSAPYRPSHLSECPKLILQTAPRGDERNRSKIEIVKVEDQGKEFPTVICRFKGGNADIFRGGYFNPDRPDHLSDVVSIQGKPKEEFLRDQLFNFTVYSTDMAKFQKLPNLGRSLQKVLSGGKK
jgi:hypothetical protein